MGKGTVNDQERRPDPLACATCGHAIEAHHPGEYGRDVCVALGYREPWGGKCPCEGFAIRRQSWWQRAQAGQLVRKDMTGAVLA